MKNLMSFCDLCGEKANVPAISIMASKKDNKINWNVCDMHKQIMAKDINLFTEV